MRKRNCRVEVCFTKDELTVLSKKAKKAGLSIGGFVRRSVADKEIKEAPPVQKRIGGNQSRHENGV